MLIFLFIGYTFAKWEADGPFFVAVITLDAKYYYHYYTVLHYGRCCDSRCLDLGHKSFVCIDVRGAAAIFLGLFLPWLFGYPY